jgi:uncharacterized phiE125 gp8 family phage protein
VSYQLRTITPPASEPITLAEAKLHLRVEDTTDDSYITTLMYAARVDIEAALKRQIINAQYKLVMDCPPETGVITMPRAPLVSVESVQYYANNVLTTLSPSKYVVVPGDPGYVHPVASQSWLPTLAWPSLALYWPATDVRADAIQISFTAGMGATVGDLDPGAAAVVKCAMFLLLGHKYEHRQAVLADQGVTALELPLGVDRVLDPLRTGVYR